MVGLLATRSSTSSSILDVRFFAVRTMVRIKRIGHHVARTVAAWIALTPFVIVGFNKVLTEGLTMIHNLDTTAAALRANVDPRAHRIPTGQVNTG